MKKLFTTGVLVLVMILSFSTRKEDINYTTSSDTKYTNIVEAKNYESINAKKKTTKKTTKKKTTKKKTTKKTTKKKTTKKKTTKKKTIKKVARKYYASKTAKKKTTTKVKATKKYTVKKTAVKSSAVSYSVSELQAYAHDLVINTYGWSEEDFSALVNLWNRESGWNPNSHNKSSGAHGIPQSLPASKMRSEGADYYTNGKTQIRWGLKYILGRYGSPSKAWKHFQKKGWY